MRSVFVGFTVGLLSVAVAFGQTPRPAAAASQQALVNKYCAGCHNDKSKAGGFSWTTVDLADPARNAAQVERVIRKLRAGMMPPAGMPRPDSATANEFAASLESAIDRAAAQQPYAG